MKKTKKPEELRFHTVQLFSPLDRKCESEIFITHALPMSISRTMSAEGSQDEPKGGGVRDSDSLSNCDAQSDSQNAKKVDVQSRQAFKSEDYRQLFHLPPDEVLVKDFNCALQKKILLQGHMYLFEGYVCFYSNIFGYEKKKVIPLKDVILVKKAKTAGMFPNAVEITAWGKKHFFASFLSRDEAYRLLTEGWTRHSAYAKPFLQSQISPFASPDGRRDISASSPEHFIYPSLSGQSDATSDRQDDEAYSPLNGAFTPTMEPMEDDSFASDKYLETPSLKECTHLASNSGIWNIEEESAPELPKNLKKIVECEFPIGEAEFFQLFFSDEAVKFVEMFHKKCGDEDFSCTKWVKHHQFGHVRDISFRHPINLYFGPKASYCHEIQRFKVYSNRHVIIETSQQLADVPYGGYFQVEVRWDVKRLLTRLTPFCSVEISLDVAFSKTTVWRNKIIQGTLEESKEAYSTWIHEALALLEEAGLLHQKDHIANSDHERSRTAEIEALPSTVTFNPNPATTPASNGKESPEKSADLVEKVQHFELRHSQPVLYESERLPSKLSNAPTAETSYKRKHIGSVEKNNSRGIQEETKASSDYEISQSAMTSLIKFRADRRTGPGDVLKVLLFIFAMIILMLQIAIMVILTRAPQSERLVQMSGTYGQEELKWLEQRAYSVKEEIMKSESHLQSLQSDITSLKMRFHLLGQLYPNIDLKKQNVSLNTVPK